MDLTIELIAFKAPDTSLPWETGEVKAVNVTKGFHKHYHHY
jgi:hypothetical protein